MTLNRIRYRLYQQLLNIESQSAIFDSERWFAIMDALRIVKSK